MSRSVLASIEVVDNGWTVILSSRYGSDEHLNCATWPEVEAALKNHAFPYPKKDERREPW